MSVLATVVIALLGGCATMTPVTTKTQRDFKGFSIRLPEGPEWFVLRLRDDSVGFEKRSSQGEHRLMVGVDRYPVSESYGTPNDYLAHVNATFFRADPQYYEFLGKDAQVSRKYGDYCVQYNYKYKDTKMKRPKDIAYVVHEGRCYVCLHPESKKYEFNICRSEEYAPGQEDPQLRAEEDGFIEAFAFSQFVTGTQIHILSHVPSTFFTIMAEVDAKQVGKFSECGSTSQADINPGQHTLSVFYGGVGRADISNRPEIAFQVQQGVSKYFVIVQKDWVGKLMYNMNIREVSEQEWIDKARLGAGAPACKGYY